MESINRIEKKRVIVSLILATLMISGALVAIAPTAKAQVEDAKFIGTVTIGASPAADTLVMYTLGLGAEEYPADNSTVTDQFGNYEIWVEGGYTYWLYFANGGAMFDANATVEQSIDPGQTVVVDADLTPAPARTVTLMGYATNASNPSEPVITGHVLGMRMASEEGPDYINWTVTDSSGYYEMDLIPGRIGAAIFDAEGYYPAMVGMDEDPLILDNPGESGWLNISLFPYGAGNVYITGNVTDYSTSLPIENALVEAMHYGMPFAEDNYTNSTGGYSLTVIEGTGTMIASATGYTMLREDNINFGGNVTKDFELHQINCRAYGYILDEVTLAPIPDAEVSAYSSIGGKIDGNQGLFNETISGPDGYYEMNLSDGEWDIWAEANGYGGNGTHVTLNPMDDLLVSISLSPENSLFKGYVRNNETGNPIGGVTVAIGETPGDMDNSTLTNASGYFEMYCAPGNYSFFFYPMSGYMYEIQVSDLTEINQSETKWVNRSLEPATTDLYGTVTDNVTHDPLYGVEVRVYHEIGNDPSFMRGAFGSTDISGNYSIMIAPHPETGLMASLDDYDDYNTMLDIPDVPAYEWNFTMIDNVPPIADAGAGQNTLENMIVTLDGSGSTDNIGIVNYTWEFVDDSTAITLYGVTAQYTFETAGNYSILLTVRDGASLTDSNSTYVQVNADTEPPVANAGANQTVDAGDEVIFNGSGSTDNVGIVNYTWTFTDGTAQTLYGISPHYTFVNTGTYIVMLNVTDEASLSDTDNVTITVEVEEEEDTTPPTADAGSNQNVSAGAIVTFDGSGSTDNVGVVNYTWAFVYEGDTETLYGVAPTFEFDTAGVYEVTLTVRDAANLTDTDTVTITVNEPEEDAITSFLTEYWWIIVAAVAIAAVSIAAYMMMKGGKGDKKPSAPETKPKPEQIEEEIPPPPPDD